LLDTPSDPVLDGLVRCAAEVTGCPISIVSLLSHDRQWFKARVGLDATQTPRDWAFCGHAILGDTLFEVPDALNDARFADNPLVTGGPRVRYYAGVPLRVGDHRLGTLCVIDREPRCLNEVQRGRLEDIAASVSHWLESRREHLALVRSQARLAEFARVTADWLWECDAQMRVTWCSEAFEQASGLPLAAVIGRQMLDALLLDGFGEPLQPTQYLGDLMRRGERFDNALIERRYPNGQCLLSIAALPCVDADGRPNGWRGTVRDVSDLVAARRAAHTDKQLIDKTSRLVPGVIFQLRQGPGGRMSVPFASARLADLYELEPEALRESPDAALARLHPQDRPGFVDAMARSVRQLIPWRHEYRVVLPRRGVRWLEGHATPERQADGAVLWQGFVADVTERRALDAEMLETRQRQQAAEQSSRDKSLFLSRLSHELRTPLNAVLGFTSLLQMDGAEPLTGGQLARVKQVQRAGEHLLSLLNDVLDIGRIEHQHRTLDLASVALDKVIDDCLLFITPLALGMAVDVEFAGNLDRLYVQADRRALKQVFTNLLSNGVKYNRRGGRLLVSTRAQPGEAVIVVRDQGQGIAPQRLAELFQPFNRLGAENSGIEGSGLGLVIARQLCEAMGARLEVESWPGVGTEFRLLLPLADPAAPTLPIPLEELAEPEPDVAATLLYIEDDPVNALLLREALRDRRQWRLVVAADGIEGLAQARRLHPELVLTDVNLPGLSGLDVVRALRLDPATRDIDCVALSADALPEQMELAREAGCDDYWTKPLDLSRVAARIARRLGGRRAAVAELTASD
jgi:signal transduction histidine kinase/GAF domain-containing protein/ActR/RegA family two-component response regulator